MFCVCKEKEATVIFLPTEYINKALGHLVQGTLTDSPKLPTCITQGSFGSIYGAICQKERSTLVAAYSNTCHSNPYGLSLVFGFYAFCSFISLYSYCNTPILITLKGRCVYIYIYTQLVPFILQLFQPHDNVLVSKSQL